jgi:hypothetical protein
LQTYKATLSEGIEVCKYLRNCLDELRNNSPTTEGFTMTTLSNGSPIVVQRSVTVFLYPDTMDEEQLNELKRLNGDITFSPTTNFNRE